MSGTARAIRIDDEVWQEAFSTRVPSRRSQARRSVSAADAGRPRALRAVEAVEPLPDLGYGEAGIERGTARQADSYEPADAYEPPASTRRTVQIQGRGAERNLPVTDTRRRNRPVYQRAGFSPDKIAMWAMFLGMLLVVVAALTAHA